MEKAISAADANRKFSELLRHVRDGQTYVVTSHGRPVARIVPLGDGLVADKARTALFTRLRGEPVSKVGRWKRADLYE
jgi:prevent-host-death family protein